MAQSYQTPGVYIVKPEQPFPTAIVPVATAIPAFIGYTQQTISSVSHQNKDLLMVPVMINSLREFEEVFGTGHIQLFTATVIASPGVLPAKPALPASYATASYDRASLPPAPVLNLSIGQYLLTPGGADTIDTNLFYLYSAVRLFYLNGGATCYILSLGTYAAAVSITSPPPRALPLYSEAIARLELEPEPTMLLCPDALLYDIDDYNTVMQLMLAHCNKMQSRVALFDVYGGAGAGLKPGADPSTIAGASIQEFRSGVGQNYFDFGIAYFPWVNTTLFSASDITFLYFDAAILTALGAVLNPVPVAPATTPVQLVVPEWAVAIRTPAALPIDIFAEAVALQTYFNSPGSITLQNLVDVSGNPLTQVQAVTQLQARIVALNDVLKTVFPDYELLTAAIASYLSTQPVAPALAGVFTVVDNQVGVWKAPVNVSLTAVTSPALEINDLLQADMTLDAATGISVNAIRAFQGQGTLVWGDRMLAGNSQDWRYINVRRTLIFIEQSVTCTVRNYAFSPNDANTWATVKDMISSFLLNIWKQGGLAGTVPADAFSVSVGLGVTMTPDDILNGYLRIVVYVAITRPAEFIIFTFQQQMQNS